MDTDRRPAAHPSKTVASPYWPALHAELLAQYDNAHQPATLLDIAARAEAAADHAAAAVALSLAIERIHSRRETFAGLQQLTERLVALPALDDCELPTEFRIWPVLGQFLVRLFAQDHDDRLKHAANALLALIVRPDPAATALAAATRLTAARHLLGVADLLRDEGLLIRLDNIAGECMRVNTINTDAIALWWGERIVIANIHADRAADHRPDYEVVRDACEDFLQHHPHADAQFKLLRVRVERAVPAGDWAAAEAALLEMPRHIGPTKQVNLLNFLRTRGYFALERGNSTDAERDFRQALDLAGEIEAPPPQRAATAFHLAAALLHQNRLAEACTILDDGHRYAPTLQVPYFDALSALAHSAAIWYEDRDTALAHLRRGLGLYRQLGRYQFLITAPTLAFLTASRALQHDVERAFVTEAIRRRNWALSRAAENWPWTIRLRLFGGFVVERQTDTGSTTAPNRGKAQQKPIAILRALALLGPQGGDRRALARRVWRGTDPDAQTDALDMGIGRARKLLGDDGLIQVQDGRIRLDDNRVYVDIWAFDEVEQRVRTLSDGVTRRLELEDLGSQLIRLYVGRLFDDDDTLTASAVVIEQFRERFIGMAIAIAQSLASHDLPSAIDLLQRAIEREPYSERLYRGLIEQLARAGEYAEAMRWYRRCQHAVSQAYGVAISPNTEALLELIRLPSASPRVDG